MRKRVWGFTLVEVMVALFILALTFIGVIASASHVSRTVATLEEKTYALWVLQNAIAEINVGLWGDVSNNMSFQNQMKMGNNTWYWYASAKPEGKQVRITVRVMADKQGQSIVEKVYDATP